MHLLIILIHPDSQLLLSTSKQLEDALGGYSTLYAYDNLSSDPYPGNMHLIIVLTFFHFSVSVLTCDLQRIRLGYNCLHNLFGLAVQVQLLCRCSDVQLSVTLQSQGLV